MSPIDLIRRGIAGSSWKDVCEGFARLTGERLKPPASEGLPEGLKGSLRTLHGYLNTLFADTTPVEPAPGPAEPDDEEEEEEAASDDEEEEVPAEPPAEKADPSSKFKVVHGEAVNEQGKRAARAETIDTQKHENHFRDDRKLARKTIKESETISKSFEGKDHRPDYKPVQVTCARCNKTESVHPDLVPRRLDPEDDMPAYTCNRCQGGGRR